MLHSRIDPRSTTVRRRIVAGTAVALVILSATACWETHTCSPDAEEVLEIGALVSLSGSNSGTGLVHLEAMECALEDARAEFAEEGLDFRLNFSDTQSDPYAASVLMNNHLLRNIRVVIGPYTSAQVVAVESRIGDSQSLLISPSSTSMLLANRNDHIFRLAPNDSHMAESLVDLIWRRGKNFLVLVYRDDPWGRSVSTEVQGEFEAKGGSVVSAYAYDPQSNNDLTSLLRQVQTDITAATGGGPISQGAIQLTSMDESVQIFRSAIDSVPQLRDVSWFGSDGFVGSWSIFSELALAEFAVDVDYTAPIYRVDVPDRYWHVIERIESTTGVTPGSYSLLTYDATRVAARTLANVRHGASYDELEATLAAVMADYEGVSGCVELDVMGDRYDGEYDFYTVRTDGLAYWWARTSSSGRRPQPGTE